MSGLFCSTACREALGAFSPHPPTPPNHRSWSLFALPWSRPGTPSAPGKEAGRRGEGGRKRCLPRDAVMGSRWRGPGSRAPLRPGRGRPACRWLRRLPPPSCRAAPLGRRRPSRLGWLARKEGGPASPPGCRRSAGPGRPGGHSSSRRTWGKQKGASGLQRPGRGREGVEVSRAAPLSRAGRRAALRGTAAAPPSPIDPSPRAGPGEDHRLCPLGRAGRSAGKNSCRPPALLSSSGEEQRGHCSSGRKPSSTQRHQRDPQKPLKSLPKT